MPKLNIATNKTQLLKDFIAFAVISYCLYSIFHISIHLHYLVSSGHHIYRLLLLLVLLYISARLRHGYLISWYLSMIILGVLLTSYGLRLSSGHSHELLPFVLTISLIITLGLCYKAFNVRYSAYSFRTATVSLVIMSFGILLYGTMGFLRIDTYTFGRNFTVQEAFIQTIKELSPSSTSLEVSSERGEIFVESIPVLGFLMLLLFVFSIYKPARFNLRFSASEYIMALELRNRFSTDSEDWFKVWPKNMHYFFLNDAFVAYRVKHGIAYAIGDVCGKKSEKNACLNGWIDFVIAQGWHPAIVSASKSTAKACENAGLKSIVIGGEAMVSTDNFVSKTRNSSHFRNAYNKAKRLHFAFEVLAPPHSDKTLRDLNEISDMWLNSNNRKERQFGLGYYEETYIKQCEIAVVRNENGKIIAFTNIIPSPNKNVASSVDLMRYRPGTDRVVMYYLLGELICQQNRLGASRFNLGLVPLAKESLVSQERLQENLLLLTRTISNNMFSFSGLEQFKNKFEPKLTDKYIIYTPKRIAQTMVGLDRLMQVKL